MSDDVTLAQLAADIAQLRQQIAIVNQRLDMIYGAVTRLADAKPAGPSPAAGNAANPQPRQTEVKQQAAPSSVTDRPLSASMMMEPGGMLEALRQYAVDAGLNISFETVDRLKSNLPAEETNDESN
jgi:hypothetical protein